MFDFDVEAIVADLRHARAATGRAYTVLLLADGETRLEVSAWEALPEGVAIGSRIEARVVVRSRQSGGRWWTDAKELFAEDEAEKPAAAATPAPQHCTAGAASATGTAGASGETFAEYRARLLKGSFLS